MEQHIQKSKNYVLSTPAVLTEVARALEDHGVLSCSSLGLP